MAKIKEIKAYQSDGGWWHFYPDRGGDILALKDLKNITSIEIIEEISIEELNARLNQ